MKQRTYVDVHILQTVPPSNINRDDAGTPKQAVYGGIRRARVSSQAWKRATRTAFADRLHLPEQDRGVRTKRISAMLAERLSERTKLDTAAATRLSTYLLKDLGITAAKPKTGKGKTAKPADSENAAANAAAETSYLLFFGNQQLDAIAGLVDDTAANLVGLDDDALSAAVADLPVREQLQKGHPIDVALFGRMVADLSMLNVDAAAQVAHALSTHAVEIEFDYFTAVDDEKDRSTEDAGAAMIGTVEFTAATLYRYATVGIHQLQDNLDGDPAATVAALTAFLQAFVYSMPTGHQNTFAHRTLPHLVSVVVRDDQPVNLVSAFELPIRSSQDAGIADKSASKLADELTRAKTMWGLTPLLVASQYTIGDNTNTAQFDAAFGEPRPFPEVINTVAATVASRLSQKAEA